MSVNDLGANGAGRLRIVDAATADDARSTMAPEVAARFALINLMGYVLAHPRRGVSARRASPIGVMSMPTAHSVRSRR